MSRSTIQSERQRHLGTPAAVDQSLQAPRAAPPAPWVRPIGRLGLGERADDDFIAAVPLVSSFSEQQEFVGGQTRHELPEGVRSSHIDLSHPPDRPPGGIVAK